MYQGHTLTLKSIDQGWAELCFDRADLVNNRLDSLTLQELHEALLHLQQCSTIQGLLISSAKEQFIVGADIAEFTVLFQLPEAEIVRKITHSNQIFSLLEQLPFPTVTVMNGLALAGGLELALATDFRMLSVHAQVGLPEVTIGVFPGLGGTVRLPRISNVATALKLISTGKPIDAATALQLGIVDAIESPDKLNQTARDWLSDAVTGKVNWQAKRSLKQEPVAQHKRMTSDAMAQQKLQLSQTRVKHQPAAMMALELLENTQGLSSEQALTLESMQFAALAKTQAASSLVQNFLNHQQLKKALKHNYSAADRVTETAVIGAGIMGGGIAFTHASKGIGVRVKDVSEPALSHAAEEFNRLLTQQLKSGRVLPADSQQIQSRFSTQQDNAGFAQLQLMIEAVTEKLALKRQVLADIEAVLDEHCVIATNTSSLCVQDLASGLHRPERFVGLHFFNPVPAMPLVEVVKGPSTNRKSLALAVHYVQQLGKTPIVVNDCAGFLVNRILTPYSNAFFKLVAQGVCIEQIDRVMQDFGWPMGPAYLQDVVGFDTLIHVLHNISVAYKERMDSSASALLQTWVSHGFLGQKNGKGFYQYHLNAANKLEKSINQAFVQLTKTETVPSLTDQDIVYLLMLPMLLEAVHCLQEKVVSSAFELDIAAQLGIGFPAYLGGPLQYIDYLGAEQVIRLAEHYQLAQLIPARLRQMANTQSRFYPRSNLNR